MKEDSATVSEASDSSKLGAFLKKLGKKKESKEEKKSLEERLERLRKAMESSKKKG
jgi:hypothetical protein